MNKLNLSNTGDRIFGKILRRQAEEAADTVFLRTDKVRISFAEAEQQTNRLAAGLKALGVGRGDRVALYMGNRPEMVLIALAVNKLGAIWTPINTDYKGEWLRDTLLRCRCSLLVTDGSYQQRLLPLLPELQIPRYVLLGDGQQSLIDGAQHYSELLQSEALQPDYSADDYGDTCAILWTSGTTGKSKGVMQSYNAWIHAILNGCREQYDSREGDVIYCVLPLFNTGAWITSILRALLEGITVVIEPKFSVSHFWERIRHFGATQTFAIGAMGVFLLDAPAQPDDADNPLRVAQIVPLPANLWGPFEQRFGVRLVRSGLGQSECQMVTSQWEDRDDVPVHAMGFPHEDTRVSLFDDDGIEVEDGAVGEIAVKPLQPYLIFNGYFDDEEGTAAAFRDGWYLTGDMARKDPATGAFFFVDRKRDAVRYAGRNISTLEVESVARRHPAVKDVAAFGIACREVESEQELKLNIVLQSGADISCEELCRFVNDNAPHYFVPRYIEFVAELPYTPTNKVQKYKLRQQGLGPDTWDLKTSAYVVQR